MKKDLFGNDDAKNHYEDKSNPFKYEIPRDITQETGDKSEYIREQAIKEYCAIPKTAAVNGEYEIIVQSRLFPTDVQLTLSPLLKSMPKPLSEKLVFEKMKLVDLSEWYVVAARYKGETTSRVIKIATDDIPIKDRDSAVFGSIIKDKNAFLNYIVFLLSDDYLLAFLEGIKKKQGGFAFFSLNYDTPILYERMLKAAVASPDNLREIRYFIDLIGDKMDNDEYKETYKQFKKLYEQFERVVDV